jgi:hypothetical protein
MAQAVEDTTPTKITQLRPKADPTNAERQRRHRAKQRKRRATAEPKSGVTLLPVTPVTLDAVMEDRSHSLKERFAKVVAMGEEVERITDEARRVAAHARQWIREHDRAGT